MLNSFIVAAATAILSTYFSALTAYGLHAYHFKLKRLAFLFIMLFSLFFSFLPLPLFLLLHEVLPEIWSV